MSLELLNISAVALAATSTVVAALIKTFAERIAERRFRIVAAPFANEAAPTVTEDPLQPALDRLDEVYAALTRQQAAARTNRWMSRFLTVGQYIIGGLLASSFVQQSLSREVVGALGLLVLLSSLIYQHFRPDIQLRGAMSRSMRLRALIREANDDIYAMRSKSQGAPTIDQFRRKISSVLSGIESSEYQDLTARIGEDLQNNSSK